MKFVLNFECEIADHLKSGKNGSSNRCQLSKNHSSLSNNRPLTKDEYENSKNVGS